MNDFQRRRVLNWSFVCAWTVMIYASAFYAVPLAREMYTRLNMKAVMAIAFAGLVFLGTLAFFLKAGGFRSSRQVMPMILVMAAFAVQYCLAERHAKRFHLIEYSFLSYLLHRALQPDFKGARLWILAFMGALLVGLGDEALQHWIPERISSWPDILINMKGAFFGLAVLAFMTKQKTDNHESHSN